MAKKEGSIKKDRKTDKTKLIELKSSQQALPILDVRENIIVTKDAEYYKMLEVLPINFELRSADERAAIIERLSAGIRTWPNEVHIKIISSQANVDKFIDNIHAHWETEESEACRRMQLDQAKMIEEFGQRQGVARRFFISFPYEKEARFRRAPTYDEIRHSLNNQENIIRNTLYECGNAVISEPDRDDTIGCLYATTCYGQSQQVPWKEHRQQVIDKYYEKYNDDIDVNKVPAADFIAPARIDFSYSPNYAVIDGKFICYCYVPGNAYPTTAFGGWLQTIFGYMPEVTVDFWIRKENVEQIANRLGFELKNKRIQQMHADDIDRNYDDIMEGLGAGYYIKSAIANGDDFCYMAMMLTITADTKEELDELYEEMRRYLVRNDMTLKRCFAQQEDAWHSSFMCSTLKDNIFAKAKRNIMGSQLGSCYPFTAYDLRDDGGVFLGLNARYGSPIFMNIFDTTTYQNANMMLFGSSGSGKTYTLLCMLLRMRQQGIRVFCIAPLKGHEFYRACLSVGGEIIRIAPGSVQNINIMEIRKKDTSTNDVLNGDVVQGSILSAKIQQLHKFYTLLLPDIDAAEKQILDETLVRTYAKFGISTKNRSLNDPNNPGHYKQMPVLGDLHKELVNSGTEAKRLYSALARFVSGSAKSFNQPTNVNLDNKFVVLDVSDLTEELVPIGIFICLDYVIDKLSEDRTKNTVVALDEMWKLFATPMSANFCVSVWKTIRGLGGSAIGATQDIEDLLNSEKGAAIINNSKIKILLPMDKQEIQAIRKVVELTSEEAKRLKKGETMATRDGKRKPSDALMIANTNHLFVTIKASATEHDLITTSATDLRRIAEEARQKEGGVQ